MTVGVGSDICFAIARKLVLKRQLGSAGANPATFEGEAYQSWRVSELLDQFNMFFSKSDVQGCDVVDFGCGEGALSFYMATLDVKSVVGVDVSSDRIASAKRRLESQDLPIRPDFRHARCTDKVELADASADVILCFDVLEHIMDFTAIVPEWKRVLRNDGRVLIWWIPWYHPYGHHIESLVPIPWAHVVWSDKTLIDTCGKIYDMPEFNPRVWDLDKSGAKKPNKWLTMQALPEVNRLTIKQFDRLCDEVGLVRSRKDLNGFGSSKLAKLTNAFLDVPFLKEFFVSSVVYDLRFQS